MSPRVAGRLTALAVMLAGLSASATPPAPAPTSIGLMRLRPGLTFAPQGSVALSTQDVEIEHGGNPAFHSFPLNVTEVGAHSLQGIAFDLVLEEADGLGFGLGAELARLSGGPVSARISSPRDPIAEQVPGLVEGVPGAITGYLRFAVTADMSYRVRFEGFALFGQAGLGLGITSVDLAFVLGSHRNQVSATAAEVVIPAQVGADVALSGALFATVGYTFYVVPTASQRFNAGIGLTF